MRVRYSLSNNKMSKTHEYIRGSIEDFGNAHVLKTTQKIPTGEAYLGFYHCIPPWYKNAMRINKIMYYLVLCSYIYNSEW